MDKKQIEQLGDTLFDALTQCKTVPPLTSQLVSLIKDTSLVSAIAVADLTMQAQVLIADTFLAFEIWLIVAALYLALTLCVALPARWMERRYAWR